MFGVKYNMNFQQFEMDKKRREQAAELFANVASITKIAQSDIFTNIIPISLNNGSIGIGYYIAPNFIMTNAHVLPTYESIQNSSITSHGIIENSFHRPVNPHAPDMALIKIKNPVNNVKGIAKDFSDDEALEESLLFFVNYNFEIQNFELIPVRLVSNPGEFPLKYTCLNDTIPQPGCSGSPIIEARVILAREPYWQFRQVSMVYARCDIAAASDEKLLCALPINFDLEQIYQLQSLLEEVDHFSAMATAASIMNDEKQSQELLQEKAKTDYQANTQFIAYNSGQTSLDIELPDGFEKLIGSGIIELSKSLLLKRNQQFHEVTLHRSASLEELQKDLDILFAKISKHEEIKIYTGNSFFRSDKSDGSDGSDFFRIDVCYGSNKEWKIDLQDNTGKRVKIGSKSASSVFAIVIIPKDIKIIEGEKLVNSLKMSMQEKKPCKYDAQTKENNIESKKNISASSHKKSL